MIRLDIDYSKYSEWDLSAKLMDLDPETLEAFRQLAYSFYILEWDSSKQVAIENIRDNYTHELVDGWHRDHAAILSIQHSLYQVGQRTPILLCDNLLIDGHRRLEAAKALGWNTIAAIQIPPETESSTLIGMRQLLNQSKQNT